MGSEEEEEHTLREDYEQFMRPDGTYEVYYSCSCQRCKFKWRYEHKEKVPVLRATLTTTPANWTDGT